MTQICLREQQRTGGGAVVECRCPKCAPESPEPLSEPVRDGEFFCRCGYEDNGENVQRCDAVIAEARRLLAEDEEWLLDPDDDDRWFLRVLWFAVATKWHVEVYGDQWFAVALTRTRYGGGDERTEQRLCRFECDDPFDAICAGYVFMRQVGGDA